MKICSKRTRNVFLIEGTSVVEDNIKPYIVAVAKASSRFPVSSLIQREVFKRRIATEIS